MNDKYRFAKNNQRVGAYYHLLSRVGDDEGDEPSRLALYQRLSAAQYSAARYFMGLEGNE